MGDVPKETAKSRDKATFFLGEAGSEHRQQKTTDRLAEVRAPKLRGGLKRDPALCLIEVFTT